MSNPQGINPQFPPAQLTLDGTVWTRDNTYSTTSAVYKCPSHPNFHITLILRTPINTTMCTQVHATPNQPTFANLHIWYNGGDNFHVGAEHFKDLTKTQQNNAYNWYLDHNAVIQTLLNAAYNELIAAKTAAFPPAPAQAAIVLQQAPQHQAIAWELAQQNAAKSHQQYASEEVELRRKLRRVRKLLDYVSLTFPDAALQGGGGTIHFICDYRKWSAPLGSAVVIWSPIKERPQEVPQAHFKDLLMHGTTADFFFVYGTLNAKGRIAWAIPRNACKEIQLDDASTDIEMQEIIRQKAKLDYVVTHVIVPEGYGVGHVFLPFIGGLIPHSGWYSYDSAKTCGNALSVAIEFKLTANKLPQCVIQILPDGSSFCAFELLRFVHATDLTAKQTVLFPGTVPVEALAAWAETLPVGAHVSGVVTIDGLRFQVGDHQTEADAATAYKIFKMPAYFLRQKGKKAYFDLAGLEPLILQGAVQQGGKKIQRAKYDEGRQLLIWPDKSTFPLPEMVLSTLPEVKDPESVPPEQCVLITGQNGNVGVFYVLDLYEATPTCTVLCMLGDSYVLETSTGIHVATHILQLCDSPENIMVMGDGGFMGWINLALTLPLKDYLKASGLLTTGCVKIEEVEVRSGGAKWWKVRVLEAECWVCTVHLQQVISTADDELQMLSWVLETGRDGIVLITDEDGAWLTRASRIVLEAPPVATSSNSISSSD